MRYTLWSRDILVGETDFGLAREDRRRLGVLQPATSGLMILPALTDMMPALFGIEALLKRSGVTLEEIDRDPDAALAAFDESPEGQRVLAAGKQVADLVLRDEGGRPVEFESILVSDVERFAELGVEVRPETARRRLSDASEDPIRYLISVTLKGREAGRAGMLD